MELCEEDKFFGQELILNCRAGNDAVCDKEKIQAFLNELIVDIEMEKEGDSDITHFGEGKLAGWTMLQKIKTSSIVFHFCDDTKNFYGNLFSCKKFSTIKVRDCVLKHFAPNLIQELTLNRGV